MTNDQVDRCPRCGESSPYVFMCVFGRWVCNRCRYSDAFGQRYVSVLERTRARVR